MVRQVPISCGSCLGFNFTLVGESLCVDIGLPRIFPSLITVTYVIVMIKHSRGQNDHLVYMVKLP